MNPSPACKYVSDGLIASSADRGWDQMRVEVRRHGAGQIVNKAIQRDTELAVDLVGHSEATVVRRSGAIAETTRSRNGMIWMCPGGIVEDSIYLSAPMSRQLHLYLPETLFSEDVLGENVGSRDDILTYRTGFHEPLIAMMAQAIGHEVLWPTSAGKILADALLTAIAARLVHLSYPHNRDVTSEAYGGLDRRRALRIVDFIEANLEGDLSLATLAEVACLSRFHFSRAFKETFGVSPYRYVSQKRLGRAVVLLRGSSRTVEDIALALGFASPASFTKAFRRSSGWSPSDFRKGVEGPTQG